MPPVSLPPWPITAKVLGCLVYKMLRTLVIGAEVGNVGEELPKVQCNPKSNRLARLVCGSARVRCY